MNKYRTLFVKFCLLCSALIFLSCTMDAADSDSAYYSSASSTSSSASGTGTASTSSDSAAETLASGSSTAPSSASSATGSAFSAENTLYILLSDDGSKVSSDNSEWTDLSTLKVKFFDDTVTACYSDESEGVIKISAESITQALAISVSGSIVNGGINGGLKIQTSASYETGLYLNDVTITSTNYPCIDMTKGGAVTVFLSGTNTLTDGRSYGYGYGDSTDTCDSSRIGSAEGSDNKGALVNKGDLTICASSLNASLIVTQAFKNCVASNDGYLTIESGTFILKNYIYDSTAPLSDYSSIISNAKVGKNGLYGGQGLIVNGGDITFYGCGIVTKSDVRKANALKTDDDDYTDSYISITGGSIYVQTYNGKGINAPYVYISGGSMDITSSGVTGFSDGGIANCTYYNADGEIESDTIKFSAEAIEGDLGLSVSGGSVIVNALDDGLNVSEYGGTLAISGGFVFVKSQGDGLDSNGNITISGGLTVISQTGSGNSPIDAGDGYKFRVTGSNAVVFAMGASGMFSESIPSSTVSPMIYKTSLGSSSSSSLGVNGIIALKAPLSYQAALLVSPSLTSGSSYSFVKGGSISGTEISESGVYFPASISGGTSYSASASTSASSKQRGF